MASNDQRKLTCIFAVAYYECVLIAADLHTNMAGIILHLINKNLPYNYFTDRNDLPIPLEVRCSRGIVRPRGSGIVPY